MRSIIPRRQLVPAKHLPRPKELGTTNMVHQNTFMVEVVVDTTYLIVLLILISLGEDRDGGKRNTTPNDGDLVSTDSRFVPYGTLFARNPFHTFAEESVLRISSL